MRPTRFSSGAVSVERVLSSGQSSKTSSAPNRPIWACACSWANASPLFPRPIFRLARRRRTAGTRRRHGAPGTRRQICLPGAGRSARAQTYPELDIEDARRAAAPNSSIERARAVEGAAMAVAGITNSEGGGASFGRIGDRARNQRRASSAVMPRRATASAWRLWPAKAPAWRPITKAPARATPAISSRRRRRPTRGRTHRRAARSAQGEVAGRCRWSMIRACRPVSSGISPAPFPAPRSRAA